MKKDPPVAAWRCEECRDWRPASEEVFSILVLEIGPDAEMNDAVERVYYPRRLRVCLACRAEITGGDIGFERTRRWQEPKP